MKTITILVSACILCFQACSQDFKKLDKSDLDSVKIQIAKQFSIDYFTKLKNGSFYQFKDEAIDALKDQLTEQKQKAVYKQIIENFGDLNSLSYVETWIQSSNPDMKIFRFKGDFDKSKDKLEIRVVILKSGKIAGFWIKPWNDMLQ